FWVYLRNQFYMTNESVIQEIQHSLFSKHEQTVSLGSIEDASFRQSGILQTMLNYGTVRLSTEGEETTYRFAFVENPRAQVAIVNNGVEAFKNGRPVDLNGLDN
ncbi:MAG TPA: PH domain-containing protein, partial [Candidatus Saccharimonadales bacterium]